MIGMGSLREPALARSSSGWNLFESSMASRQAISFMGSIPASSCGVIGVPMRGEIETLGLDLLPDAQTDQRLGDFHEDEGQRNRPDESCEHARHLHGQLRHHRRAAAEADAPEFGRHAREP